MISLDFETYCDIDIRKVGLDAYTSHPSFEVMMMAYRLDDGPLLHWQAHLAPFPQEVRERLQDPAESKWAYNATFERRSAMRGLGIDTPIEGWRCSMALAYMRSFTGSLAEVGAQMLLPRDLQKQKIGARLIQKFCKPQRLTKNQPNRRRNWQTDPGDWQLFVEYNLGDVVAEESVRDRLLPYPLLEDEWQLYALDQKINDTGMPFDRQFALNVHLMSERRREELLDTLRGLTGVKNPNSQIQLLEWLQTQGYPFHDIGSPTMRRAFNLCQTGELNLPPICLEAMRLREWSGKTATKKAVTALRSAGPDDRIRFMYQFAGASRTARWSGRLTQPQNFARTPKLFDPEHDSTRLDVVTDLIRYGDYDTIDMIVIEPMMLLGGTMRGMFRASPGHLLHVCDYSSIESVGLGWAAGCNRILQIFRDQRDFYRDFGTSLYLKPYDQITSAERQICKSACLGCGYGLGPGEILENGMMTGLLGYAANMQIGMSPEEAAAAVRAYREAYTEVPQFWYACANAAQSVLEDSHTVAVGPFVFSYWKPFLLIRLPSGRHLYYYKPRMELREYTRKVRRWNSEAMRMEVVEETRLRNVFTYMGRNQHNSQWERIAGFGSSLVENIVQALCRDILKVGLQRLDAEGFHIVGHAHDEIIVEGDTSRTWEAMREIMTQPIDWLPDFPLGAAGWSGQYYRK